MSHLPVHALLLQAAGGSPMMVLLLQFGLIFAIFYFLVIRPQQRQRKAHEERLRGLKRGDQVVTAGGVVGEVVQVGPAPEGRAALDDHVTIKSGDTRLIVERARIAKVGGVEAPPSRTAP
jgi:preprotein translocase subunit YajC